ncbi:unnamed protein product [Sphagnum compactum]
MHIEGNVGKAIIKQLYGEKDSNFREASMSTTAVQKLYDVCKATFSASSGVPSAAALERVRLALENVKALDVGLEEEEQQERGFGFFGSNGETGRHSSMVPRWSPPISYLHLYECEQFSMGIFCLPTSAAIPLHNHPGMTVLSRLLYGSVHVRAYDWVNPFDEKLNADPSRPRLAKLVVDHVLTAPCETAVLYPTTGGNIHAFTALTPCALLDVLAPPYSPATGRHCTYYHNVPRAVFADGSDALQENGDIAAENPNYEWLEGFQPPEDFVVQRGIYRGPKVVP